ncbi:MAG TPA: cytochrome c oxidase subunit II [Gemmatimonadales bacterium]|nr:cytochrome c oxidase subunit II [Gemmatimonadales bacterium]
MRVHTYEKAFLTVGILVLLACMAALVYASTVRGMHLPGAEGRIAPAQVYRTEPFRKPGVRQTGPNRYEAAIVAQAWVFNPAEIRVPAGAEVTFTATSVDILHGFEVEGTRLNMMLVPGQISRLTHTFRERGTHLLICHEYCGLGHHTMYGKVIVE